MMADAVRDFHVLFLCTGNSARSIMAEAYLASLSDGAGARFTAHSAGSHPTGQVNPFALDVLAVAKVPVQGLRSKSWDEFARPDAPRMDFVFTVCDNAAGEACPVWPGQPMTAHWPFVDPAAFQGSETEIRAAVFDIFRQIRARIDIFASLPVATLDRLALKRELDALGRAPAPVPDLSA